MFESVHEHDEAFLISGKTGSDNESRDDVSELSNYAVHFENEDFAPFREFVDINLGNSMPAWCKFAIYRGYFNLF